MRPPRLYLCFRNPNAGGVIDPAPPNLRRRKPEEGEGGIFDELLDGDEEGDGLFAVDQPVVVGEGEIHHRPDFHLAIDGDRTRLDRVHAEDGGLRGIENGSRHHRAVNPAVGDGEDPANP